MRLLPLAADAGGFADAIETLRYRFHKWDAWLHGRLRVLPEALLLSADEHASAVACVEGVCRALAAAADRVGEEHWEKLGIPGKVWPLLRAERDELRWQLARYDLIPTDAGWMIPEFNEDAPGGFNEALAARPVFGPLLGEGTIPGDFGEALLTGLPPGRRCALVYATGYAEDLQHMLAIADLLGARGVEVVLAGPNQLSCPRFGKPRLAGTSVDWIFRFFPGEWYAFLDDLSGWQRAVARVPVVNPLRRLLRQSKALYAHWRDDPSLAAADRQWLDRHTPETTPFDPARVEEWLDQREGWALKRAFGRMGDAVLLGRLCTAEEWRQALAAAAREPVGHLLQRAFVPQALPSAGGPPQFPALGLYLVNGAFAGYYSRAEEKGFTTHEANYVVTAVETP